MAEAELRIRPTVVGSARSAVSQDVSVLRRVEAQQKRAISQGVAGTRRLARGWDAVSRAGRGAASIVGRVANNVLSLKGLVTGLAVGGGAKTVFDLLIGSNAKLEQQRITFETMIGDAGKAAKLLSQLRENAATTPFAEDDVIEGSKRLLRLTRGNIKENIRLLNIAETMAAVNPEKSVSEAVEAILDAETEEFERLKEFGIKLRKSDVENIKKRGETMGQAAIRGVEEAVSRQTGGRDIVGRLSESFFGRVSTVRDRIKNSLRDFGREAFEESKGTLEEFASSMEEILADEQFRRDADQLASSFLGMAEGATELARELPSALRDFRSFVSENKTLLKLGGGALVANKLAGGALGRGAASVARTALLGGRGGGGGLGAAAAGAGGAIPVFVVNMGPGGGMGGGGGGFFGRTSSVLGKSGAPLTTAGLLKSGGLSGAAASVGAGGALGIAAIPAAFAGGVLALKQATEGTQSAVQALEERLARERGPQGSVKARADRAVREARTAQRTGLRRQLTGDFRTRIDEAILAGDQQRKRKLVQQAVGATTQRLRSAQSKEERGAIMAALDQEIAGFGVDAEFRRGKLRFKADKDAESERLKERGGIFARELNSVRPQFNVVVQSTGDPEQDGKNMSEAAWKKWRELEEQAARQQAKIGPG